MYRFVLRDAETMDDLGKFRCETPAWGLGDVFITGDGRRLRIVDFLQMPERPEPHVAGAWLVEDAARAASHDNPRIQFSS